MEPEVQVKLQGVQLRWRECPFLSKIAVFERNHMYWKLRLISGKVDLNLSGSRRSWRC